MQNWIAIIQNKSYVLYYEYNTYDLFFQFNKPFQSTIYRTEGREDHKQRESEIREGIFN